jgi:Transcriptional regulators of sugar metabolism
MKKILNLLGEKESVSVKDAAQLLDVSEMTVRRDINYLEKNGYVITFHGGISLNQKNKEFVSSFRYTPYLFDKADSERLAEKKRIAEFATSLIEPFDAICIDTGTTCRYMVDYMKDISDCILYTYSMEVLMKAINVENNNIRIFFFGGHYHKDIKMFESTDVLEIIKKTHINKLFLGAVGISSTYGLSCAQRYEVDIRRTLMSVSEKVIILADSSKINKSWYLQYADISDVDILITDNKITAEQKESLMNCGITVYVV